jgi:hypothetical protein
MSIPKQSTVQATQSSAPLAEDPKIIQFMRTEEEIESWALSSDNKQTNNGEDSSWVGSGHPHLDWEDEDSGDCCSCHQLREESGHRRHREDLRDGAIGYPSPLGFILLPPMKRISLVWSSIAPPRLLDPTLPRTQSRRERFPTQR